jgi:hypothetical protein
MDSAAMRIAGLFVVIGLALSGCTGSSPDPEVTASSTANSTGNSTPAVSASPSPSVPTKPERPDAMERDDAKGAAAAAEYFIELYPYVMATGDTKEFEAMSHRACGFCDDALEQAKRIEEGGWAYTGGGSTLSLVEAYKRDELTGVYPLDVEISQESSQISESGGAQLDSVESKVFDRRIEMGLRDGEWVVVTVAPIPEADR